MGNVMNVEYLNCEYEKHRPIWLLIRDCIAGEKAVKDRDRGFTANAQYSNLNGQNLGYAQPVYLPMPNPTDLSPENRARYAQYLMRASFVGYTGRTLNGMMGIVFKTDPKLELPTGLEYLEFDVDGSDVGIVQQSEQVCRDVASIGRCGLLVDHPQTDGQVTKAQAERAGIRATINYYPAETILDWGTKRFGAKTKLSYVKLEEEVMERNQETYECEKKYQYRCLHLSDDQVYSVKIYNDAGELITDEFMPTMGNGKTFDHIPFYFAGAQNNRPNVDDAPLQEIADVNIKHYRNSADYEESSFVVGQPTLFISSMNEAWMEKFYSGGIPFGSRAGIAGPQGSDAKLLQSDPNNMPMKGMEHKEQQLIALGARLVTSGGQNETAEAARIKHEADTSSLSVAVRNVNKAYDNALFDVALFSNVSDEGIVFEINTQLVDMTISPADAEALVRLWQSGAIDKDVLDSKLKKGGIIYESKDVEEMNRNIEDEDQGLNLNAGNIDSPDE